jgi:hypothetical protein
VILDVGKIELNTTLKGISSGMDLNTSRPFFLLG